MGNDLDSWKEMHKFYMYNNYLTKNLAAYLKVSPRTIQRWLKGKACPNPKKLDLIKKYLQENSKKATSEQ
jgi:hypothetical protein